MLVRIGTRAKAARASRLRLAIALAVTAAISTTSAIPVIASLPSLISYDNNSVREKIKFGALSLVGSNSATTTSVTIPAHQAGDLLVMFAYISSSTTPPTQPTTGGWVTLTTKTGTTQSCRISYKTCTGTSDTSGTWTNATELCVHVMRASLGFTALPGTFATSSSTTTTVTFPALTLADTSGNSWVLGFAGASNSTQTLSTAPTGMTNRQNPVVASTSQAASDDTNGGVSSWSVQTITAGTGNSVSATVEILLLPMDNGGNYANVYQHVGGGTNPNQNGGGQASSTSYTLPLPLPMGAGNLGVLWLTVDNGTTPSVSDNINGSWGAAVISATSAGNQDSFCFLHANHLASGSTQPVITVSLVSATLSFQWTYTELNGMAASSVSAGTHSSILAAGPNLSAGSFTPSAANCVILAYCSKNVGLNGQNSLPSRIVAMTNGTTNFTLLDACIGENSSPAGVTTNITAFSDTHASQIYVQGAAAAINPAFTVIGDTDTFNTLAIALKTSARRGTVQPSGAQIARMQNFTTNGFPASGAYIVQASAMGNCGVITSDDPSLNALTVTDSEGNSWSVHPAASGIWYMPNRSNNPNLQIYITGGGTDTKLSWRWLDLYGIDPNPLDAGGSIANAQSVPSVTSFTASPAPAPTSTSGIVIANIGLGNGPGLAVTAPTGAIWLLANYPGENDLDYMGNADICAAYQYSASGSQTWTFSITSVAGNSTSGGFLALKAAPVVPPCVLPTVVRVLP